MEKPNWVKELETKILEIAGRSTTDDQFWISLTGYCNYHEIAIDTPRQLESKGCIVFFAQKTHEVGIPTSLQILKIKKEELNNIF